MAKRHDAIIVEGLNVRWMMHNQPLSRGIGDASLYTFKLKLKWKAKKYGRNMIEIGRFDPSSKLCSQCDNIRHGLKLSYRTYRCDVYGLVIDSDHNAFRNIRRIGLIKVVPVRPEFTPVEISTSGLYGICPYGRMSAPGAGGSEVSAGGRSPAVMSLPLYWFSAPGSAYILMGQPLIARSGRPWVGPGGFTTSRGSWRIWLNGRFRRPNI